MQIVRHHEIRDVLAGREREVVEVVRASAVIVLNSLRTGHPEALIDADGLQVGELLPSSAPARAAR
jgi:hypothetical protein